MIKLLSTKIYLVGCLLLLFIYSQTQADEYTQAGKLLESHTVSDARAFFVGHPTGVVAFLPDVIDKETAKKANNFLVLEGSGAYTLPKQKVCWFIINHRDTSIAGGTANYLKVQIANYGDTAQTETGQVYYNERWEHLTDEMKAKADKNISEGSDQGDNDSLSQEIRGKFVPPIPEGKHVFQKSFLLGFQNTHREVSNYPLLFTFNCEFADYIRLKTSSSDNDKYNNDYFFTVEK